MNDDMQPDVAPTEQRAVTEQEAQMAVDNLRSEQNLAIGAIAGALAAIAGAGVWAAITVITEHQIGWMAVGIGLLVGIAMRFTGKGIDPVFGFIGAALSLVGCILGNIFTVTYFIALNEGIPFLDILGQLNPAVTIELMTATFQVMDLLFYGLAVYFGYRYAFRQVTEEDFNRALGRAL